MAELDPSLQAALAAYPRWLLALGAIVVAAAAMWLLAKVLKWTIYLAAFVAFACVAVGVVAWWMT